jgi:SAM-dependent methyltransferase
MDHPQDLLLAKADELCQSPEFRDVVWRCCGYHAGTADIGRLNTHIHRNDQMLLHSLNYFQEVNWSLSQYFNIALQQHHAVRQLLRLMFGTAVADCHILDFACGYGRLLRFLTLSVPPTRIWASEIQPDALDFVVREFGVHGTISNVNPDRFEPGRQFDFIWAASLFSHLPRHLFHGWLARLTSILEPHGVLCFSARDERDLPPDIPMPHGGFHFSPVSENEPLDNSVYGTTWVTEAFVRRAIVEVAGEEFACFRIKRGLANEQDIYVVSKRRGDLDRLTSFRKGAWGWVDECRVSEAGELYVRGWAASLDDGAIDFVTVTLDGRTYRCPTGLESDDVRRVLNDDRLAFCDWEFKNLLEQSSTAFLEITAGSDDDETALLYAGPITRPT